MKTIKSMIILAFLISGIFDDLNAQNNGKSALELGIDLARFNQNWIYVQSHHPRKGSEYSFDFIPSIFVKLPKKKFNLRLKYEFLAKNYSSYSMTFDAYETIEGRLKEHTLLFGLERNLVNKKIRIYYLSDIGISFSKFNGKYAHNLVISSLYTYEPFNIKQFSFLLQPGMGISLKLSDKLSLNLESTFCLGRGFENPNKDYILPNSRFTLRPISLFGLSYKLK